MTLDERAPRRPRRRAVGQLERDLARPGELALDREQPDADADRATSAHRRRSAAVAGDEQPVADRQDRRLEPRIGEDGRVERAQRASCPASAVGAGPTTRPLQRTLSATTSAPGASRGTSASR